MFWLIGTLAVFLLTEKKKIVEIVHALTNKDDGLKAITAAALPVANETGVPISIIVTQAAHESNYGLSELAQKSNNLFGIKAGVSWQGAKDNYPTTEFVGGLPRTVDALFRSYPTWTDSVRDWAKLIRNNYPAAWALAVAGHADAFFQSIATEGKFGPYATDPQYAKKLVEIFSSISKKVEALT